MTQAVAAVHAGADAGGAVVGMVRSLRGSLGCLHGGSVRTVLRSLAAQLERGAGRCWQNSGAWESTCRKVVTSSDRVAAFRPSSWT